MTGSTSIEGDKPLDSEGVFKIKASGVHHTVLPKFIECACNSHYVFLETLKRIAAVQGSITVDAEFVTLPNGDQIDLGKLLGSRPLLPLEIGMIDRLPYNWHFVYAHGSLEQALMDDRVSFNADPNQFVDGIHAARTRTGQTVNVYLWTTPGGMRKGLCTLTDDLEACAYALDSMTNKRASV